MRIIVTGATGFIGRALVEALLARGDEVTALTRNAQKAQETLGPRVRAVEWAASPEPAPWMETFNGADGAVNLAGELIFGKPWTEAQRRRIKESRTNATAAVVQAITRASPRPFVLVSGSAVGYYGDGGDTTLTESSPPGSDFLARVCQAWEEAAKPVEEVGVRLVLVRTGFPLHGSGGILPLMALPFRVGFGFRGDPRQWFSWIHLEDEVGLILHALTQEGLRGPVNASAPNPVTMDVLTRGIGKALHRPVWVPVLKAPLKMALGEMGRIAFASQRMLPQAALAAGYPFRYTDLDQALRSIFSR